MTAAIKKVKGLVAWIGLNPNKGAGYIAGALILIMLQKRIWLSIIVVIFILEKDIFITTTPISHCTLKSDHSIRYDIIMIS